VALSVLEKKIFENLAFFQFFSLPVQKIFRITEPCEKILKRTPQGKCLQNISFLVVTVSWKVFKEKLMLDLYA
jgi:hypothetical protein